MQVSIFDACQLSLFDAPMRDKFPSSEAEMVEMISKRVGLKFEYVDELWGWVAKTKYCRFTLHYSNYKLDDKHDRFISCGYDYHKGKSLGGSGSPCDSIDEAVRFFKRGIAEWVQKGELK